MKKFIVALFVLALCASAVAGTHVRGYTNKDGKHVAPHYRSHRDHTKRNNYTTKGNVNPYTGKKGPKKIN